jgi:hypothetical protein
LKKCGLAHPAFLEDREACRLSQCALPCDEAR